MCSTYVCGVGLRANNSAADVACTAQKCASVCCQPAECEMLPQAGYVTCPATPIGGTCDVRCAAGYSGRLAKYKCQVVGEVTMFVPEGPVHMCNLLRPCAGYTCAGTSAPMAGASNVQCTDDVDCQSRCCIQSNPVRMCTDMPYVVRYSCGVAEGVSAMPTVI
jgi:hypothetical protein